MERKSGLPRVFNPRSIMNSHQVRVNQFIFRGFFLPRYVCTESKIFILLRRLVVIVLFVCCRLRIVHFSFMPLEIISDSFPADVSLFLNCILSNCTFFHSCSFFLSFLCLHKQQKRDGISRGESYKQRAIIHSHIHLIT